MARLCVAHHVTTPGILKLAFLELLCCANKHVVDSSDLPLPMRLTLLVMGFHNLS